MPGGRPKGSTKPRIMSEALTLALNREAGQGKTKQLNIIATKLVELAATGDVQAIREVFDRVEGKPPQAVQVGDPNDEPMVFRVIADIGPRSKD